MQKQKHRTGNALWPIRHARGLELKQVAKMLGQKSTDTLSKYERGIKRPSLKNIVKLTLIYNINLKEMFPELIDICREEIDASIKQRSFVFSWPERQKILEHLHFCSFEELLENSDIPDDDKDIVRIHLRTLANKVSYL